MAFYRRICRQCGHHTLPMTQCRRDDCELAERTDLDSQHEHCREECRCTTAGCQGAKVPL